MALNRNAEIKKQIARLRHPDPKERTIATQTLSGMCNLKGTRKAIPALSLATKDTDPMVCLDAARALFRIDPGNEEALQTFLDSLRHKEEAVRIEAVVVLYGLIVSPVKVLPFFLKALNDPSEEMRARTCGAIEGLGRTETGGGVGTLPPSITAPVIPALIKCLNDPCDSVRQSASNTLWKFGGRAKDALPAIIKNAKSKDWQLRLASIIALARIGGPAAAFPILCTALRDEEFEVKDHAVFEIARFGPASAPVVHDLIEALKDPDIRQPAANALGDIGPAAKKAIPALLPLRGLDGGDLCYENAIKKIQGK